MYNKVNVKRHQEERECPNCGKKWIIWARNTEPVNTFRFCAECNSKLSTWEKKKIVMEKFPERRKNYLQQKREEFLRNYIKHMIHSSRRRAEEKGIEFNISEEGIIIPEICPILEVPLVIGTKDNYEYSPSIDRIDNSKGYIKGNIMIISKKANSMKNSATLSELKMFCKNILRYSLNNREDESIELEDKELLG